MTTYTHLAKSPAGWLLLAAALLVLCQVGCKPIMPEVKGRSPLKTASLSQDSLVLDIFFIRFPFDDEAVNVDLWGEIDEQHFSPACRNRLFRNGFRVGRVGNRIPVELARLLELGEKPVSSDQPRRLELEDIEDGPSVRRRHLQIRPGRRSEIIASSFYDELPVITKDRSGQISGEVFRQAQAILAFNTRAECDGRISLNITPEVHHGQPKQRWVGGNQGVLQLDSSREREVFESLAAEATLEPGEMFVIASLPNRPGSLGHYFLTETKSGKLQQKLLIIRLSQTQHDNLFGDARADDETSY